MATTYDYPYQDTLDDVSNRLAASRLSQRLSRDSGTLGSIRSVRSSRIEKPRSTQNSPQGLQRRRTTSLAQGHPLHRQTPNIPNDCQYGPNVAQPYRARQAARPITWHPALFQQGQQLVTSQPHVEAPMHILGLQPQHQRTSTFAEQVAGDFVGNTQLDQLQYPDYSQISPDEAAWDSYQIVNGDYATSFDAVTLQDNSWYVPDYTSMQNGPTEPAWTKRTSSDMMPLQQPPELVEDKTPQMQQTLPGTTQAAGEDKVLVGLGLYDPPATPPHPFASAFNQGKGLKLEEPWAPPLDPGDEDGEGEDDDEIINNNNIEDSTTAAYSLPVESQNVVTQMQKQAALYKDTGWMLQQQHLDAATIGMQPRVEEQSFIFGDGGELGGEWWYNPAASMRAQEQGFGQGWLNA